MPKPGGCHSSGISLGDALRLPKRHPAWRRREAQSGSRKKLPSAAGPWRQSGVLKEPRAQYRRDFGRFRTVSTRAREAEWELGTFATDKYRADRLEMVQAFLETEVVEIVGAQFVAQEGGELLVLLQERVLVAWGKHHLAPLRERICYPRLQSTGLSRVPDRGRVGRIELAGGELGRCDMLGRLDDGHAER
jgi:hypothetical protein